MKLSILITIFLLKLSSLVFSQSFELEKLPESVNSIYDEISPVVSRDGKTLYFTRVGYPEFDKTLILEGENFAETLSAAEFQQKLSSIFSQLGAGWEVDCSQSKFNQDIWLAKTDENLNFKRVEHPRFPLNNAFPNSIVCQTPDAQTFYVVNQFPENGGVEKGFSVIQKEETGWSNPQPIEIEDFYTITSDVSLTMGFDGQTLILAAERFDSENMDLYVCFRAGENQWSSPKHLGKTINSVARETTPFLSEDNQTLFFSSNRKGSGNDIFLSRRLDESWQNWSVPEPLAEPINSWADDSQPYFNMTTGYLYFTSKRGGGSDIYRIQIAPPQPTEISISGRIIDEKTGDIISDVLIGYSTISGQKNYSKDEKGFYHLTIPRGVRYFLEFKKNGYATQIQEFFIGNSKQHLFQENLTRDILVAPLEVNSKIDLEPIFFVQSQASILAKSFSALRKLADFLKENPRISIRVEGHTDNVGKENELIRLAEDRANALKTFLVNEGVAESRIETLGFGAKFPLNDNSTEELKKQNRRVEIRIIKN